MRCPKDADAGIDNCPSINKDTYHLCTRTKGHKGMHHAHTFNNNCCKVWK